MNTGNHRELERLEGTLAQSDPALAGKYGIFNRLTEDEPFARAEPVPESAAAAPGSPVPAPRPEVREPCVPVPRPGAPWGAGPVAWHTMEPRSASISGAWLLPLLVFSMLAGVMFIGLMMSS